MASNCACGGNASLAPHRIEDCLAVIEARLATRLDALESARGFATLQRGTGRDVPSGSRELAPGWVRLEAPGRHRGSRWECAFKVAGGWWQHCERPPVFANNDTDYGACETCAQVAGVFAPAPSAPAESPSEAAPGDGEACSRCGASLQGCVCVDGPFQQLSPPVAAAPSEAPKGCEPTCGLIDSVGVVRWCSSACRDAGRPVNAAGGGNARQLACPCRSEWHGSSGCSDGVEVGGFCKWCRENCECAQSPPIESPGCGRNLCHLSPDRVLRCGERTPGLILRLCEDCGARNRAKYGQVACAVHELQPAASPAPTLLRRLCALVPQIMDALESDADTEQRRMAFEAVQDFFDDPEAQKYHPGATIPSPPTDPTPSAATPSGAVAPVTAGQVRAAMAWIGGHPMHLRTVERYLDWSESVEAALRAELDAARSVSAAAQIISRKATAERDALRAELARVNAERAAPAETAPAGTGTPGAAASRERACGLVGLCWSRIGHDPKCDTATALLDDVDRTAEARGRDAALRDIPEVAAWRALDEWHRNAVLGDLTGQKPRADYVHRDIARRVLEAFCTEPKKGDETP